MSSLSMLALGRRRVAVLMAGAVAAGGIAAVQTSAAHAHETKVDLAMTCMLPGLPAQAITVGYTVDHEPEAPVPGETFTISTKSAVALDPTIAQLAVAIKSITITIPAPPEVGAAGDITLEGGNFTKAGQSTEGSSAVLSLQANAGVTTANLDMPTLKIPVTIPGDYAGEPIEFQGPSKLELTVELTPGSPISSSCTANAENPPLLVVNPDPNAPTTTRATTTTTTTAGEGDDGGTGDEGKAPEPVRVTPRYTG